MQKTSKRWAGLALVAIGGAGFLAACDEESVQEARCDLLEHQLDGLSGQIEGWMSDQQELDEDDPLYNTKVGALSDLINAAIDRYEDLEAEYFDSGCGVN